MTTCLPRPVYMAAVVVLVSEVLVWLFVRFQLLRSEVQSDSECFVLDLLLRSKWFSFRVDPFLEGRLNNFHRVTSPQNIPTPFLKFASLCKISLQSKIPFAICTLRFLIISHYENIPNTLKILPPKN